MKALARVCRCPQRRQCTPSQIHGEPPLPRLPTDTASRWITSGWEVRIF